MQYGAKEITDMTTEELWSASIALQQTMTDRENLKSQSRYQKKFANQNEPGINPAFLELKAAIENELKNRTEKNV